jgi:hypothetical protein
MLRIAAEAPTTLERQLPISGLDPVLRDMLRICRLGRVFDLHTDEAEASGAAARRDIPGAWALGS